MKTNYTKLRLLSLSRMMEEDTVTIGNSNLSSMVTVSPSIILDTLSSDISSGEEDDDVQEIAFTRESTSFKAEKINNTIRLVLSEYDVEVTEAINNKTFICIIADSASVNRRSARLLGVPFVNCLIHAYNLSIRALTSKDNIMYDSNLTKLIEESNRLARHFKLLKSGTVLRQFTPLTPKLACPTRWSGNKALIFRYDKLRPFYIDALKH